MYDRNTWQGYDHYFSFKHIPGCGKQPRPMTFRKNEDSFEGAKKEIKMLIEHETFRLLGNGDTFHILLSGGLDSCIVLHIIRKFALHCKIISHTLNYTGTWEGKSLDLEYARKLSKIYRTEHHEHVVTEKQMIDEMPLILNKLGMPFSGFVSPWFAAKMLPPDVSVFTGDLSDELFGSYKGPREISKLDLPKQMWLGWRAQLDGWIVFTKEEKEQLYSDKFKALVDLESAERLMKTWMPETDDKINAMLGFDWVSTLPDQVFYSPQKLMPNADLSPYMSPQLIDYVTALPGEYKVKDSNVKYILKEAFKDEIPDFVVDREKEGFVQPSNYWLLHNWKPCATNMVIGASGHGLWNEDYIQKLVRDFYDGKTELQYKVWSLLCFHIWWSYVRRA